MVSVDPARDPVKRRDQAGSVLTVTVKSYRRSQNAAWLKKSDTLAPTATSYVHGAAMITGTR